MRFALPGVVVLLLAMLAQVSSASAAAWDVSKMATGGNGTLANPWRGWDATVQQYSKAGQKGISLYFPQGHFLLTRPIDFLAGWRIRGEGMENSCIITPKTYTQSGIRIVGPSNQQISGWNDISDITIQCGDVSEKANGVGIECVGYGHLSFTNVRVMNWKYGITLDQAALVYINRCHFIMQSPNNLIGLWIVNGEARIPGQWGGATNVIHVDQCNFNGSSTQGQMFIVDDGGYAHSITRNHFGAGGGAGFYAGVFNLLLENNYYETFRGPLVTFDYRQFHRKYGVGQCKSANLLNEMFSNGNRVAIEIVSMGTAAINGCGFYGKPDDGKPPIVGAGHAYSLTGSGNTWIPEIPLSDAAFGKETK